MQVLIDNHGTRNCQAWIESLQKNDRIAYKKLRADLDYLELFGKEILKGAPRPKNIKPLKGTNGIWQIRIDDHRVLFFYYDGDTIIVTNGFTKKSNGTPPQQIKNAILTQQRHKQIK